MSTNDEELILVTTKDQLFQLMEYIKDKDIIAYDTETNGTTKDAEIIGFSICAEPNKAYYVVLSYWEVQEITVQQLVKTKKNRKSKDMAEEQVVAILEPPQELQEAQYEDVVKLSGRLVPLETKQHAKACIELLVGRSLIMHNAIFDCSQTFNNFGVSLIESVHTDTMILGHLLDENRRNGLKELGVSIFGADAKKEQEEMKASVLRNGGVLTKDKYELYKADFDLLGKYGCKDAILTYNLFYHFVPQLAEQGLWDFFYTDESMPLLKGPTYQLNTVGLKVDTDKLETLKKSLEAEILELKSYIYKEITPLVQSKYKCTNKSNTFNIGSGKQLSWLLYFELGNKFSTLTDEGRELCKCLGLKMPYGDKDKRVFIELVQAAYGTVYKSSGWDFKKKKKTPEKKVGHPWNYLASDKKALAKLSDKYKWVEKLLEYSKAQKILKTYVIGIGEKLRYGIIHPSFLQHGTTSGRFSSRAPNFQNIPRKDKRIKECIVAREGKVFVGADYSQLEPRVFTSVSQDPTLLECFKKGEDFYSVVGIPMFDRYDSSAFKENENSFANKYPKDRDTAKAFALATPYGTSAFRQSQDINKSSDDCQEIIDKYFAAYPKVLEMMLSKHELAKKHGVVYSLYGRPRRIPEAMDIPRIYGKNTPHSKLPYTARTLLNLGMNHSVQSSAATIVNRASIAFCDLVKSLLKEASIEANIVLQVHDEVVVECDEQDGETVADILKFSMEQTTLLPGVDLIAKPVIAKNLADLK